VAQAFALALKLPHTENRTYDAGGPESMTFNTIIDTLAQVLDRKIYKLHLPVWPMRLAAGLLGGFAWFPVTKGQIRMLLEGNTCEPEPFYQDFGITSFSFKQGLAGYLT
jgi:NADH dehydrogenase